jgi:hypothetical protein
MPTVRLIRETKGSGSAVTLSCYVDGSEVASLDNGESTQFYVASGRHAIQVRYDQVFLNAAPKYGGGQSHSKGESGVLNLDLGYDDIVLRCGFKFFGGAYLQLE